MRTEQDIREQLEAVIWMQQTPCNCKGDKHEIACQRGGFMLLAVEHHLKWILEEEEEPSVVTLARELIKERNAYKGD